MRDFALGMVVLIGAASMGLGLAGILAGNQIVFEAPRGNAAQLERQTRALEQASRAQWAQVYWLRRATLECSSEHELGQILGGVDVVVDPE